MGFLIVIGGVLAINGLSYLFSETGSAVEGKPPVVTVKKSVEFLKEYNKKIPEMNHRDASLLSWEMLKSGQINKNLSLSCFQNDPSERYFVNYLDLEINEVKHLRYFFLPKISSEHSIKYRFSTSNQVVKKFVKEKINNYIDIKTVTCKRCLSGEKGSFEVRVTDSSCREGERLYDIVTEVYLPTGRR